MYGWIITSFESMVLNNHGPAKWKEILELADCTIEAGQFVKNVHYSDELIHNIISASTRILNTPQNELIEALGENFINFIRENGYDSTIRSQGTTFAEFLRNLNEPHRLLRSRFPASYLPEFWCTKFERVNETTQTCLLNYYSQRGFLFAPMVIGLLRRLGRELYGVAVEMHQLHQLPEETYVHTIWTVTFTDLPESEFGPSRNSSMSTTSAASNRVLQCPFSHHQTISPEKIASTKGKHRKQVGLSHQRFAKLFPFHVIINEDLEIIQYGEKFRDFLKLDPSQEVYLVEQVFAFQTPPGLPWSWDTIQSLTNDCVELFAKRIEGNVTFRGEVMILDPDTDPGIEEACALFLLSPVVYNLQELENLNMNLNDFPIHSFQRDLLVVGEHVQVEQEMALRLDVLSRRLEVEGKRNLNSLKTKRAFVRYVSHEVRSPLNVALLGLRYVSDQIHQSIMHEKAEVEQVLSEVKNSCVVAVDILNDLLLYEKFDDGMFTLAKSEVRMTDYFHEAVSVYHVQAKSSEIRYEVQVGTGLEDILVNVDITKFTQVLRNLISNALKFTPKGGNVTTSCVVIPTDHDDSQIHFAPMPPAIKEQFEYSYLPNQISLGYIRVKVKDSGAGISLENQKRMFDQFIQFDADKLQKGGGSGLGLWIASSIMHLHGGRLGVYSPGEGKGTEFVADLPIHRIETNPVRMKKVVQRSLKKLMDDESLVSKLKSIRLLIVDDSSMNRKIVRRVLEGKFDMIDEAENGFEAMAKFREAAEQQQPYHLIMMDSQMPVMNGLDATKSIKELFGSVTIVGVTGNALKQEIDSFLHAGADKVMVKPLNLEEFFGYIHEVNWKDQNH